MLVIINNKDERHAHNLETGLYLKVNQHVSRDTPGTYTVQWTGLYLHLK